MKKIFLFIILIVCIALFASCKGTALSETKINSSKLTVFSDDETNLFGYKNEDGNIVIPCQFERAEEFKNDRALVWKNKKCGYISPTGEVVIDFIYTEGAPFSNGRALVGKGGKLGFIDANGTPITDFVYDNATSFNAGGYATVFKDGRSFDIDKDGNEIVSDKK